jgi:tRNA(Arg) A34 adenosine deaminase TadA
VVGYEVLGETYAVRLNGFGPVCVLSRAESRYLQSSPVASHEQLLLQAIAIARDARTHGNHPFGALLADREGHVLLTAENTVVTNRDATGHAETNLIRKATGVYSPAELADSALYTSAEPCAMCAGAIYWSGISTVIYALAESTLYELAGNDPENLTLALPCRAVFAAGRRLITVLGPFDLDEAHQVHAGFWHPLNDA